MKNPLFDTLPGHADCWLYVADRMLSADEVEELNGLFQSFERDWSSHGRKVIGACEVVDGRLVVVAAHVQQGDISGCGIDKSLHLLQQIAENRGFTWASALNTVYRDANGSLQVATRKEFKQAAATGEISEDTLVVDLSIRSLEALRSGGLERRVRDSWHSMLLPAATAL